ncbi:MAG: protein phosphatase 2C domain-containing protein [Nitrososphaerales archaeon]|jgi:serine/threonine protein phosphatase PrpC
MILAIEDLPSAGAGKRALTDMQAYYTTGPWAPSLLQVASRSVPGSVHPYEDRVLVDEKTGLFAVADGVTCSSQGSGGVAAELSLDLLRENFSGDLVSAINKVHQTVLMKRNNDKTIGETTLTAVAIHEESLQAANVGDSPAYLVKGKEMRSLIQEDRNPYGYITQVIGHPETLLVHSVHIQLEEGDLVVVASDGVGHVLHPSLVDSLAGRPDVNEIADAIIDEARVNASPYDDDKSIIVLRILR